MAIESARYVDGGGFNPALLVTVGLCRVATLVRQEKRLLRAVFKRRPFLESRVFRGYTPTGSDVFVAAWMKSGTNWLMQLCQQVACRGAAEFEHIHELVAWPEVRMHGLVPLRDDTPRRKAPTGLRVIKTHLPADYVPQHADAKYLAVARDPKEVVVSSFHFIPPLFGLEGRTTAEAWVDMFLGPDCGGTRWAEHVASWWALRDRANVDVLSFRAMKEDLEGHADRVAKAMGVELTHEERARVLERSSFEYMKNHERKFAPPRMPFAKAGAGPAMIRRGSAGASDELLSADQQAAIDRHCRAELQRLGSDFPYDDWFGA